MAFTAAHVSYVILHLGYPALPCAVATVQAALDNISTLSPDLEIVVLSMFDDLNNLRADLTSFSLYSSGIQVQTDGTVYFPVLAIAEKKARYAELQSQLAQFTQLTNYAGSSSRIRLG